MSRPMLLVFLLLILIITSQFEWRQQIANDIDPMPVVTQKQQKISRREEAVKEKIILIQENTIHRLNKLVRSLEQRLLQCQCKNVSENSSASPLTERRVIEQEQQNLVED